MDPRPNNSQRGERGRLLLPGLAACGLAAVALLAVLAPPLEAAAGSTISWQGRAWNVTGVNMPWYHWACDFGCGASSGVSDPAVQRAIEPRFADLAATGAHTVRWWMFEGDAWQIERDATGKPTRIDPRVYADIDAALALAERYDLYYTFVLFTAEGLPRSWLTDPGHRAALADVLAPLFARYADEPRVFSWEVFNEPEFAIWDGRIPEAGTVATAAAVVDAVHANGPALATVGSAMLDGLPLWTDLGLDYYQAHWYDYMGSGDWCATCTTYADLQSRYALDAPLVIGEFYAGPDVDAEQRYRDFAQRGYAGAWSWSLFAERTNDRLTVDLDALGRFVASQGDVGPSGSSSVGGDPTPTPSPAFAGDLPPEGGLALVTWGGSAVAGLQRGVPDATSFWISRHGVLVGLVPGAPAFVNEDFHAAFPDGRIPAGTPIAIVLPRR